MKKHGGGARCETSTPHSSYRVQGDMQQAVCDPLALGEMPELTNFIAQDSEALDVDGMTRGQRYYT